MKRARIDPFAQEGRVVDTHAPQNGLIATLVKAEVPTQALMDLARHSDPSLTYGTYSHLGSGDTPKALARTLTVWRDDRGRDFFPRSSRCEGQIG